jgi:hypothetical protein
MKGFTVDDRAFRQALDIAAGATLELAVSQRGHMTTIGFDALVVPVPKRAPKPSKTKARRRAREV